MILQGEDQTVHCIPWTCWGSTTGKKPSPTDLAIPSGHAWKNIHLTLIHLCAGCGLKSGLQFRWIKFLLLLTHFLIQLAWKILAAWGPLFNQNVNKWIFTFIQLFLSCSKLYYSKPQGMWSILQFDLNLANPEITVHRNRSKVLCRYVNKYAILHKVHELTCQ